MKLTAAWLVGAASLGLCALSGAAEPTAQDNFKAMQMRQAEAEFEQSKNWFALVTGDRGAAERLLQAIERSTATAKVPRISVPLVLRKQSGETLLVSQFKGSPVAVLIVHPMDPMLATYTRNLEEVRVSEASSSGLQTVIVLFGGTEQQIAKALPGVPQALTLGGALGLTKLTFFADQSQIYSGTLILIDRAAKVQYQGKVSLARISAMLGPERDAEVTAAAAELAKTQAELDAVNRQIASQGGVPCDQSYHDATAASGNLASWDAAEMKRFCGCLEANMVPVLNAHEHRAYRLNPAGFVTNASQVMNRVRAARIFEPISNCQR